jgi:PBP1b-binding outer membrane lipoprotein LpoB
MRNKFTFVISILIVILFLSGCGQKETQTPDDKGDATKSVAVAPDETEMVDCSKTEDPSCFVNRMNQCLPVTTKMTGSDGKTAIDVTILGIENETCHFQRKINNVLDLNCYFPKGTMNMDTFNQMFGNDKGLQKVVDDACKYPTGNSGW